MLAFDELLYVMTILSRRLSPSRVREQLNLVTRNALSGTRVFLSQWVDTSLSLTTKFSTSHFANNRLLCPDDGASQKLSDLRRGAKKILVPKIPRKIPHPVCSVPLAATMPNTMRVYCRSCSASRTHERTKRILRNSCIRQWGYQIGTLSSDIGN